MDGAGSWCFHMSYNQNAIKKLERVPFSAKSMIFRIFGDARIAILGFLSKPNQEIRFSWV